MRGEQGAGLPLVPVHTGTTYMLFSRAAHDLKVNIYRK